MKNRSRLFMFSAGILAIVCAAIVTGCDLPFPAGVRIELSKRIIRSGEEGTATLRNCTEETVYLPGCSVFSYERLEQGIWIDQGPDVVCVWEGYIRPVARGENFASSFRGKEAGIWRLHYLVGAGCTEGVPFSQANCAEVGEVRSPMYKVLKNTAPLAEACVATGGTVGTASCCLGVGDFTNTCVIGGCGCSPDNSHEVQVCNCPEGTCWDGSACRRQ